MEQSYYQQISDWCADHSIALTGHPERSTDIGLLKHFHIPGQDVVWRWVAPENDLALTGEHSTMAKCSSDAARHSGRRRNANECVACCGRTMALGLQCQGHEMVHGRLFVRGVNLLYPHAFSFHRVVKAGTMSVRRMWVNNIWYPIT